MEEDILEEDLERHKSVSEGQAGVSSNAPGLPIWLRHTTRHSPERLRRMLEHMTRRNFIAERRDSSAAPEPSRKGGAEFANDFVSRMVVFGVIGLLFQSRFPICLGASLFLADDEFIEWMLQKIGIRLVPDTLGAAAPGSTSSRASSPSSPVPSCATSGSPQSPSSRSASWPASRTLITIPSSTHGT